MSDVPPPPPPPPPPGGWPPLSGWSAPQGGPPAGPGDVAPGWGGPGGWPRPPGSAPYPGWVGAGPPPPPGSGRFRAHGVGELLDSAFTLYRRNVRLIIAITAVAQVPLALVSYAAYQLTGVAGATAQLQQLTTTHLTPAQLGQQFQALLPTFVALFAVLLGVALVQALVVQPIATAAMTRAVADTYLDQPVSVGSAYRAVRRRLASILAVSALLALIAIAGIAATFGLLLGVVLLFGPAGLVLWVLILPVTLLLAVFLYARWLFATPIVVLERSGAVAAMRRSWGLVAGSTLRVIGITTLVGIITGILNAIVTGLLTVLTQFGDANVQLVLSQLARLIAAVVIQPIGFIVVVLLYYDQRIRREAFDIEMLAATL